MRLLAEKAGAIPAWQGLVEFAEAQGMAPLFYAHARSAGIELPGETRLRLQGLAMRHRLAAQARARQVVEILRAGQSVGIQVVLLKGAALAQLAYPNPGLRPMRDIDLLVRPVHARDLHRLLLEIGFRPAPHSPGAPVSARHLDALCKPENDFQITVEIHDKLLDPTWRACPPEIDAWIDRARPLSYEVTPACTLALEDMLWHIFQHMINEEIRLVSIADMTSLAENFVDEIDWERVRRCYAPILSALSLFHALSPVDERLVEAAGLARAAWPSRPRIGEDMQGWPRIPLGQVRSLGAARFLRETFYPSVWWLRLYYGIENGWAVPFYRGVVHPFEIFRLSLRHLQLRFNRSGRQ